MIYPDVVQIVEYLTSVSLITFATNMCIQNYMEKKKITTTIASQCNQFIMRDLPSTETRICKRDNHEQK